MNVSHYSEEAHHICAKIIQLKNDIGSRQLDQTTKENKKKEAEDLKKEISPFKIKKRNSGGFG